MKASLTRSLSKVLMDAQFSETELIEKVNDNLLFKGAIRTSDRCLRINLEIRRD